MPRPVDDFLLDQTDDRMYCNLYDNERWIFYILYVFSLKNICNRLRS